MDTDVDECGSCCPGWASKLRPMGLHYYGGVVDDAGNLLEIHSRSTMCTLGIRTPVSKQPLSKDWTASFGTVGNYATELLPSQALVRGRGWYTRYAHG